MRTFLALILSCASLSAATGNWNGVAFTHWNGIAITSWNGTSISTAGGGGATYLVEQGFEGTGYDNSETWTEAGVATVDEDYTATVLDGSQTLQIQQGASAGSTYTTFTGLDEVWVYTLLRPASIDTGGSRYIASLNSGATILVRIRIVGNAGSVVRIECGSNASTVTGLSAGTTYHVWLHYVKGTGANAVADIAFSTDGTRPTSGNNFVQLTDGTATAQATRIVLGTEFANTHQYLWDKVRVDDVQIGDNPP